MNNSKLINILKTLSTKELSRFKQYVHSPFFNKHILVQQLCDYLLKFAPKFEHKKLSNEAVFAVLFHKSTYDETLIYTHSSNLLKLLLQYLGYLNLEQQPLELSRHSLEAVQKRGLNKQFQRSVKQYQRTLEKIPQDRDYHYHQAKLLQQLDQAKIARNQSPHLQEADAQSSLVFLIDKLQMACDMANRNSIIGSSYQPEGLEFVLAWIERDWAHYSQYPELSIHYMIYKLIETGEEVYYYKLKTLLKSKIQAYSRIKIKSTYDYLINYCIQRLNAGEQLFVREFFELHRFLLEEKILLSEQALLDEWDYKNMVTVGAKLEEFEWVKQFIYDYKDKIAAGAGSNVFAYNLAYYYYSISDYNKALELLHQVEFTDASYHIGAKLIQLKSYYALEALEAALSLIDTFKSYLQRSKVLSEQKKKMNQNMLRLSKKIILLRSRAVTFSQKQLESKKAGLRTEIEACNPIANADWLLEILERT